jgi:hypothetical protein
MQQKIVRQMALFSFLVGDKEKTDQLTEDNENGLISTHN